MLALAAMLSAHSSQELLGGRVSAAVGDFSSTDTEARLNLVLGQYDGLAALVGQSDVAATEALKARLTPLNAGFQAYIGNLARDFAMTEIALATLEVSDLEPQWDQIKNALSRVDWSAANDVAGAITAEIQKIKDRLTVTAGFTIEEYKKTVQTGLADINSLVDKFDPATTVASIQGVVKTILSPLQKVEDLKTQVETIVRGALGTVRDAVQKIDLKPLVNTVKQAMAALSSSLAEVSKIFEDLRTSIQTVLDAVKKALEAAKVFILDPQNGLKKKIEEVFNTVNSVLDGLHIQDVVNEVKALLQPINAALAKIEFQPIIKAVLDAIQTITEVLKTVGPVLVTDALKQKLADAAAFLQQIDFGKIGQDVTAAFDEILAAVDQDALGAFQTEYDQVVASLKNLDPEPALQGVQKEVFDPLLDELKKVHPADLLKPVGDAFATAHETLAKFNPVDTFSFMTDFFHGLLAKIDEISPAKLLVPIEAMLDGLRAKIAALLHFDVITAAFEKFKAWVQPAIGGLDLFSPILAEMSAGHAQMKDAIQNFDGGAFTQFLANLLHGALSRLGVVANAAGLSGVFAAITSASEAPGQRLAGMQASLDDCASRLGAVDIQSALTALGGRYSEVKAALAARSGATLPNDILQLIGALDPMPVLAPMLPKIDRVKAAAVSTAAGFGATTAPLAAVMNSLGSAYNLLQTLLSPTKLLRDMLLAPLAGLFPDQKFSGPKAVLLYFLDQFDPAELRPGLETLFGTLDAKLKMLVKDAVLDPVGEIIKTVKDAIDILNIHSLVDAIDGVFKDVEGVIQALDPSPLIKEVDADYQQIVHMLDQINPTQFIQEIAKIYDDDIVGVIQGISPEKLLLPPLRSLFEKISQALGAFDIKAIFEPVLDRLKSMDTDLGGGLQQVEASWQQMLAVLSSTTGDSASVSVSAQAA